MAWLFGLAAECDSSETNARNLATHFANYAAPLYPLSPRLVFFTSNCRRDAEGHWWLSVIPHSSPTLENNSPFLERDQPDVEKVLLEQLRSAPALYRFALTGLETEEFRRYSELLNESNLRLFPGLVLRNDVWHGLRRPGGFVHFSPHYQWLPLDPANPQIS